MQERTAFGLGPRPAGTPATLLLRPPSHAAGSVRVLGSGRRCRVALKLGPVSRSWPPVLSALTDRQTDSALDPGGASDSGCGSRNHRSRPHRERGAWTPLGPEASPRPRRPRALGTPEGTGGQWLQVLQNTVGTQSRGSARAPRGAWGARLCESPRRGPSAGAVRSRSPGGRRGGT